MLLASPRVHGLLSSGFGSYQGHGSRKQDRPTVSIKGQPQDSSLSVSPTRISPTRIAESRAVLVAASQLSSACVVCLCMPLEVLEDKPFQGHRVAENVS